MKNLYIYDTPIGKIKISDNGESIIEISTIIETNETDNIKETKLIKLAHKQLMQYFNGKRKTFDLPLELKGTEFQVRVWNELINIPYGEMRSYKQIAENIGCQKGARAVGMANNKNKIMIVIPCHRIIGSTGKLVGYAGGLNIKKTLLELEKTNKL